MSALHNLIRRPGGHHFDGLAGTNRSLHNAEVHHNTPVAVILAVKYQRLQRRCRVARGSGDVLHHILQHGLDVDSQLGGNLRRVHGGQADDVLHLLLGLGRVGAGFLGTGELNGEIGGSVIGEGALIDNLHTLIGSLIHLRA